MSVDACPSSNPEVIPEFSRREIPERFLGGQKLTVIDGTRKRMQGAGSEVDSVIPETPEFKVEDFQKSIIAYVEQYRAFVVNGFEDAEKALQDDQSPDDIERKEKLGKLIAGKEKALKDLEECEGHLMQEIENFANWSDNYHGGGLIFSADIRERLGYIKESIGGDFIKYLTEYYDRLENRINILINGIRKSGPNYLISDIDQADEQTEGDLGQVLRVMHAGYVQLSKEILDQSSEMYMQFRPGADERILSKMEEIKNDPSVTDERHTEDIACYQLERDDINEIFCGLERDIISNGELRRKLLYAIKMNLVHMNDAIVGQVSLGIEHPRKHVLQQMCYSLTVINRCIREMENVRNLRSLLLLDEQGGEISNERIADLTPQLSPEGMKVEINHFIDRCKVLPKRSDDPDLERVSEEPDSFRQPLGKEVDELFDGLEELKEIGYPLSSSGQEKLQEVRGLIGSDFNNVLSSHYHQLEDLMRELVEGVANSGVDYFMDENGDRKEEAMQALERLLEFMQSGYRVFSRQELCNLSDDYRDLKPTREGHILPKMTEVFDNHKSSKFKIEGIGRYSLGDEDIKELFENLDQIPTEEIKEKIFSLVKLHFDDVDRSLVSQTLSSFYFGDDLNEVRRILDLMSPPEQLELFFGIVNMSLKFLKNIYAQKRLLLIQEPIEDGDIMETVSAN